MQRLLLISPNKDKGLHLLCLGPHSDDIEIGAGGTILRLLNEGVVTNVTWIVFAAVGQREQEARRSAEAFLAEAEEKTIILRSFRDGFFPYIGDRVKDYFEEFKQTLQPDIIIAPYGGDKHQDHRLISELTWNTFRNHLILEYEIVKYDADLGQPNFFVPLEEETCQKKINILTTTFESQHRRDWFTKDAFLSIMRIRGIEAKSPTGYAEAFSCRKMVI